jgi:hypothetical protein
MAAGPQDQSINTIARSASRGQPKFSDLMGAAGFREVPSGSVVLRRRLKAAMTQAFLEHQRVLFAQMCRASPKTSGNHGNIATE